MRRLFSAQDGGQTAVAALSDIGIKFYCAEIWNPELLRRPLDSTFREDIDLVLAVRTMKVAHVLDHAEDVHLHAAEHLDSLARVLERDVGGCRDDDRAGEGNGLKKRDHHVAGSGREIDNQKVQFTPFHLLEKLFDDGVQHGSAPYKRLVPGRDKADRNDFDSVIGNRRNSILADHVRL